MQVQTEPIAWKTSLEQAQQQAPQGKAFLIDFSAAPE
jgi:hypothetical protein